MNIVLTVNEQNQAMLMHDAPLGFAPNWVEFSWDQRGVRIISEEGREFKSGVLVNLVDWHQLDGVHEILLVQMRNQRPFEGYVIPFVSQDYDDFLQKKGAH
jgi:hypothetical protein